MAFEVPGSWSIDQSLKDGSDYFISEVVKLKPKFPNVNVYESVLHTFFTTIHLIRSNLTDIKPIATLDVDTAGEPVILSQASEEENVPLNSSETTGAIPESCVDVQMKEEVDLDEDGRDGEVNDTSADVIEETFEREPLRKRSGRRNATAKRSLPQRRQTRSAISRVQKESGELSDPCEQCGKQFKTKTLLDRHIKGVHGPKVPCSICSHHCIPGREYDWHMKLHEKYPENRCPHCNKNYANPYVLNSHIKQAHSPEARIVCNICGNRYLESYMKRHMAMIHSKEGRALSCEHCGEVSRSSYALKVHYQKAHSDTVERKPCKVCGKTFLFQFQLKRHESVHESPQFPCEDCDKCFKRRDHLQNHRVIHQAPSALQCPECLRTYTHKRALKEHLNLHIGVRPHACEFCDETFTYRSSLHIHRRKKHENIMTSSYPGSQNNRTTELL